jgi:hypothetical protein
MNRTYDENNQLHGQPAISENGYTAFYQHGKLHNENGPAVVTPDMIAHWIEGVLVSQFFLVDGIWVSKSVQQVATPYQNMERPKKHRKLMLEDNGN